MTSGQMYNGGWVSLEPGQPPTLTDFPSICGDESVPPSCVCRRVGGSQAAARHPSLCDPGLPDPQGSLTKAQRGVCVFTDLTFCPLKEKRQAAGVLGKWEPSSSGDAALWSLSRDCSFEDGER